jgi:dUTP pyrophosphatase
VTASSVLRVQLKKLYPDAIVPKFQTEGAAGFDLHAKVSREDEKFGVVHAFTLAPRSIAAVSTGIAVSINNPDWGLFLFGRSGLGKKGIRLANSVGVIDSDYQGELIVMLRNDSDEPFTVAHGDRIAQGVFMPVRQAQFIEVEEFSVRTARGEGGFGSTGGVTL